MPSDSLLLAFHTTSVFSWVWQLRCQSAEWEDFMLDCQKCQICYPLEPHCHIWCPQVPFLVCFTFSFYLTPMSVCCDTICVVPSPLQRSLKTHAPDVMQWKCLSQFGKKWQKLPLISKKMGHINFDDLHNGLPHVISDECFQNMLRMMRLACVVFWNSVAGNHSSFYMRA